MPNFMSLGSPPKIKASLPPEKFLRSGLYAYILGQGLATKL